MVSTGKALASLWAGRCTVLVRQEVQNPVTKRIEQTEAVLAEDVPCRLSYTTIPATDGGTVARVQQATKLFLAPELEVPPGSKIVVMQHGRTETYQRSGMAAVHTNHQEIPLEPFVRWA